MRPGPPASLLTGHPGWWCQVSAWRGGVLLAESVPVSSGKVLGDASATVQRTLSLDVPRFVDGVDYRPTSAMSPLSERGVELYVRLVVAHPVTLVQWETPIGWFRIDDWKDKGSAISVQASGRMQRVVGHRLATSFAPRVGGTLGSEFRRLVPPGLSAAVDPALVDRAVPQSIEWSDDRAAAMQAIADSWPARLREDAEGTLRLLPPLPDTIGVPDVVLTDGEYQGMGVMNTVVEARPKGTRDGIYNQVIVRSSYTDDPARPPINEVVEQLTGDYAADPDGYGVVSTVSTSPLIDTPAQARAAGHAQLASALRRAEVIPVTLAPDPRLDLDDSALVRGEWDDRSGHWAIERVGFIVAYELPLTVGDGAMRVDVAVL